MLYSVGMYSINKYVVLNCMVSNIIYVSTYQTIAVQSPVKSIDCEFICLHNVDHRLILLLF